MQRSSSSCTSAKRRSRRPRGASLRQAIPNPPAARDLIAGFSVLASVVCRKLARAEGKKGGEYNAMMGDQSGGGYKPETRASPGGGG